MNDSSDFENIIKMIDELYVHQAGPFGAMVCEDALELWRQKYPQLDRLHLSEYIDSITDELPSRQTKVDFINSLKQVKELISISTVKAYLEKY